MIFASALIGSIVATIMLALAGLTIYQSPIYTLVVASLFVPFHWSDLKRSWMQRRIVAVIGRVVILFLLASCVFGVVRFGSGYGEFSTFALPPMLVVLPLLFVIFGLYGCFATFWPDQRHFAALVEMGRYSSRVADESGVWTNGR